MRIIRGKYKGRVLKGYDILGTRPTMSRVKESLFGMIQDYVMNALVLDLFAGSGNLGFEALSCGAKKVWFVDHNRKAVQTIFENANVLGVQQEIQVLCFDYSLALKQMMEEHLVFDLVFLDPPYQDHIIPSILSNLSNYGLVRRGSLIVCEVSLKESPYQGDEYELWKERHYQEKSIFIYKHL